MACVDVRAWMCSGWGRLIFMNKEFICVSIYRACEQRGAGAVGSAQRYAYIYICLRVGSSAWAKCMTLNADVLTLTVCMRLLMFRVHCHTPSFSTNKCHIHRFALHLLCDAELWFHHAGLNAFWKLNYCHFLEWLWKGCCSFGASFSSLSINLSTYLHKDPVYAKTQLLAIYPSIYLSVHLSI